MSEIIGSLTNAFTLAFVVTSMFGLGLGLTVGDILRPLRNVRLILMSLIVNFLIVPAVAFAYINLLPLDRDLQIGLVLMSAVAGAPLALKAAQLARGDVEFAVTLVTLQVVATVIYLPLALPLLIPGMEVDAIAIAMPLVLQILLPLGMGLLMNARYDEEAEMTRPVMAEISNISLAVMLVLNLGNIDAVLGLIGTGAIAGILILIATGAITGYLLGGPTLQTRRTLSLASGQRNFAAAFVIAGGSFGHLPNVLVLLLAAALISMIVILPLAGEFGRRAKARGEPGAELPVDTDPAAPILPPATQKRS